MAKFNLPVNSRVKKGKHFEAPKEAENVRRYIVYRYNPDLDENPRMDIFDIDMDNCGPCLLYTSPSPRDKRQSRMPSSA